MNLTSLSRRVLLRVWGPASSLLIACAGDEFSTNGNGGGASGSSHQYLGGASGLNQGGAMSGTGGIGASGGIGQGDECSADQFRCYGDILQVCSKLTSRYEILETCNAGQCSAKDKRCLIECQPGDFRCKGDELQICDRGAYTFSQSCSKGLCSDTSKSCLTCSPGEAKACSQSGTSQLLCDNVGIPSKEQKCPPALKFCIGDGTCVECRQGVDGDCEKSLDACFINQCSSNNTCGLVPAPKGHLLDEPSDKSCVRKACDGDGHVVTSYVDAGALCESGGIKGVCNGAGICADCEPTSVECVGLTTFRVCNQDGTWSDGKPCPASTPTCNANSCGGVVKMCAGTSHTCALLQGGNIRCWGEPYLGQTGQIGQSDLVKNPAIVNLPSLAIDLSCGLSHSCAIDVEGQLYCWGDNFNGELGTGKSSFLEVANPPTKSNSKEKFKRIVSFMAHNCAISQADELFCWGSNGDFESSHIHSAGTTHHIVTTPTKIMLSDGVPLASVKSVALGNGHTCALMINGQVYCWGDNSSGQLGNGGAAISDHFPAKVPSLPLISDIYAWGYVQIAVASPEAGSHEGYRWGSIWDTTPSNHPINFNVFTSFGVLKDFQLFGNTQNEGAVSSSDGILTIKGSNKYGIIGNGVKGSGTSFNHKIKNVAGAVIGYSHICAWYQSGTAMCWGDNSYGQLGVGDLTERLVPTNVAWLGSVFEGR